MADFLAACKALLFPQRCIFCGDLIFESERNTCEACARSLPFITEKRCAGCGCEKKQCSCSGQVMYYDCMLAPLYYKDNVRACLHKLKFRGHREFAEPLAVYMADAVRQSYAQEQFDFITCVPLYKSDHRRRGYNQSEILAAALAHQLQIPLKADALQKIYPTGRQSEQTKLTRTGNVLGAFAAAQQFDGKRVLLVDDIRTTGSTLSECGKMLYLAGASRVCCITAATVYKQKKQSMKG